MPYRVARAAYELRDTVCGGGADPAGRYWLGSEVDDIEALLQVQLTLGAVCLHAVVVVDAIGDIRGLLRLEDHRAALDGMDGAGSYLKEVSRMDGNLVQKLAPPAFLHEAGKLLG